MDSNNSNFLKQVDYITGIVGDSILYALGNFGKSALPIVSGMLFAVGVFDVFLLLTEDTALAFTIAGLSALGLESTGLNASRRAIKKPSIFTISIFIGYIVLGGGSLWFTELNTSFKVVTSTAFLLTGINYLLYGLVEKDRSEMNGTDIRESKELDIEQRDYDRRQEEKETDWKRKMKTKRVNADIKSMSNSEPVQNTVQDSLQDKSQDRKTKTDYRQLSRDDKLEIVKMSTQDIQTKYNLITRTAKRWLKNATKELKTGEL